MWLLGQICFRGALNVAVLSFRLIVFVFIYKSLSSLALSRAAEAGAVSEHQPGGDDRGGRERGRQPLQHADPCSVAGLWPQPGQVCEPGTSSVAVDFVPVFDFAGDVGGDRFGSTR